MQSQLQGNYSSCSEAGKRQRPQPNATMPGAPGAKEPRCPPKIIATKTTSFSAGPQRRAPGSLAEDGQARGRAQVNPGAGGRLDLHRRAQHRATEPRGPPPPAPEARADQYEIRGSGLSSGVVLGPMFPRRWPDRGRGRRSSRHGRLLGRRRRRAAAAPAYIKT